MQVRKVMAILLVSSASVGFISTAQAQGKTREQVRQELIEAEHNGSMYVTDTSYPDVNPIYQHLVDQKKSTHANDSAVGPELNGSTETGHSTADRWTRSAARLNRESPFSLPTKRSAGALSGANAD